MIRKAQIDDIWGILDIVERSVPLMQDVGNDQWNSSYPSREDFLKDIAAGELFVETGSDRSVLSVICLNQVEPAEYEQVQWSRSRPSLVIHRMAVDPRYRGKGLAGKLFDFAERRARDLQFDSIRSDTCCRNPGMNSLFQKKGFKKTGTIRFAGSENDFYCYEKKLSERATQQEN
ncbi:MAG: GNAT family N-acetyltransferase [Spirochaetales bacterium]|nr:GNAT family N-acetyltransferase [Spirochaetales bacterium]